MNTYQYKQQGMTLTELMVAVAVGLVVSAAVAGLFLQTTASNKQNEHITYLQDNGRYALKILADDLEMSNFWAGLSASNRNNIAIDDENIAMDGASATIKASLDNDVNTLCDNGAGSVGANWNYSFSVPMSYITSATQSAALAAYPCIDNDDNSLDFVAGSYVLMIKRTKGLEESASQVDGRPYIRGNRSTATLHKYMSADSDPPPSGFFDWQYLAHIYYIAQDSGCTTCVPKLVRQSLKEANPASGDPEFATEELAEGIERFHIMFGIDASPASGDGEIEFYTSTPTAAQLANAITAKIYVLARSETQITGYTNDKGYDLGDQPTYTPNDGYYRRVFSTTVVMKNTEAVLEM